MEGIIEWDVQLLYFIHENCKNALFDMLLPLVRNKYIWLPLYIGIIAYVMTRYHQWKSSYLLLMLIGTVALTDVSSGQLLKKYVKRSRPCMDIAHRQDVKPMVRCSYSYSFPSSHACNHFGLAVTLSFLFGTGRKWIKWLLYSWAVLICLAQIYVGAHYPLDVIGGALLGIVLARLLLSIGIRWLPQEVFKPDY